MILNHIIQDRVFQSDENTNKEDFTLFGKKECNFTIDGKQATDSFNGF